MTSVHRLWGSFVALALPLATGLVALQIPSAASSASTQSGEVLYKRCAACHTATGAGVPGAFPPLQGSFRTLAASNEGRRYLAMAVMRGLAGTIEVDGRKYRGVMPAQAGMNDAEIAAVLNHIGTKVAKSGPSFRAFTPGEAAQARIAGQKLSAADVAKLRAGSGGK